MNACESFHSHFAKNFQSPLTNVFVFSRVLFEYEEKVLVLISSTDEDYTTKNNHTRKKQEFVRKLEKYSSNEFSPLQTVQPLIYY